MNLPYDQRLTIIEFAGTPISNCSVVVVVGGRIGIDGYGIGGGKVAVDGSEDE
jgi:hypothetical protein